jgi:hypothetical protein
MPKNRFDRDELARWYAKKHLKTDPGIREVLYLPKGSPEREIRLLEINDLMAERSEDPLEPIDFGVDIGEADSHTLFVVDVTPAQWQRIISKQIQLPPNWSLEDPVRFAR